MNKLQASVRDRAAKKWREAKVFYRVGSTFKGCLNCGEMNDKGAFVTGTDVVRAYRPQNVGWTYACLTCHAKDEACWDRAWDIGEEPRLLPRQPISPYRGERGREVYTQGQYRKERRELAFPTERPIRAVKLSERELRIMALETRLAELAQVLAVGGK